MLTIFNGSFDPPHKGHLNTYLNAQRMVDNEITICICTNHLKDGLLNVHERLLIAHSLFPTKNIEVFSSKESIIQLINDADCIIRGFRDNSDIEETIRIARYYELESMKNKILYVNIDHEYHDISSTEIKRKFPSDTIYIDRALNHIGIELLSKKIN